MDQSAHWIGCAPTSSKPPRHRAKQIRVLNSFRRPMKAVNASRLRVRCFHWRNPESRSTAWPSFCEIQIPINPSLKMRCVEQTFPVSTHSEAADQTQRVEHCLPCWHALLKAFPHPASANTYLLARCLKCLWTTSGIRPSRNGRRFRANCLQISKRKNRQKNPKKSGLVTTHHRSSPVPFKRPINGSACWWTPL